MTAVEVVAAIEHAGGLVGIQNDKVHYCLPQAADYVLVDLRQQRDDVLRTPCQDI